MPVALNPSIRRQTVIGVKRKRLLDLVTRHNHFQIPIADFQLPLFVTADRPLMQSIGNRQLKIENPHEWLADPGCPPQFRKATPTWKPWHAHQQCRNEIDGLLLATFSNVSVPG
jgi:hypothetical protein